MGTQEEMKVQRTDWEKVHMDGVCLTLPPTTKTYTHTHTQRMSRQQGCGV